MAPLGRILIVSFLNLNSSYLSAWSLAFGPLRLNLPGVRRKVALSDSDMHEIDTEERESPTWCPEQQIYIGGVVPDNAEVESLLSENGGLLRIFGYGSLCWNPGAGAVLSAPGVTRKLGRARGYKRCWSQKSADHRGTPAFPGIVCTILSDNEVHGIRHQEQTPDEPPTMTEGLIYTVPPSLVDDCLAELDFREKGGYARDVIDVVEDETGKTVKALLYRGTPDNPAFWKRALLDLPFAAATMAVAIGPSGKNDEYLYKLDHFLSDAASSSPAAAAALMDHTGDNDTGSLASMARTLQQNQLYFLFGSGSNQYNQLMLESATNRACLSNGDEAHELKEIVLCTPRSTAQYSSTLRVQDKPKKLYAGGGHSALLTMSGELHLLGWNQHGQLGSTKKPVESFPMPVISELRGIKVEEAALGFSHTLIIERDTGFLFGFGSNERGQVCGSSGPPTILEPIVPPSLEGEVFVDVSAGLFHSAAITANGDLVTFGCEKYGQSLPTSDSDVIGKATWRPQDGSKIVRVECGRRHTVVLDEHGRVWTMGENKYGQLGRSCTGKWDSVPRLVDGILGSRESGCYDIACGWSHTVVTARKEAKLTEVYGWGRNDRGQLGTGSNHHLFMPTRLFDDARASIHSVACGSEYTMALDSSGSISGCGWNDHGNLSLGNVEDVFELTEIVGARVTEAPPQNENGKKIIAAGGAHFLTMAV